MQQRFGVIENRIDQPAGAVGAQLLQRGLTAECDRLVPRHGERQTG